MLGVTGWLSIVWLTFVFLGALTRRRAAPQGPATPSTSSTRTSSPTSPSARPGFPLGTDANSWDILSRLIYGAPGVAHRRLRRAHDRHGDRRRDRPGGRVHAGSVRDRPDGDRRHLPGLPGPGPADRHRGLPRLRPAERGRSGISLVSIPAFARISRATTLTFSQREFVLAAEAAGASRWRILVARDPAQRRAPADGLRPPRGRHRDRGRGQPRLPRPHRGRHDQLGRHDRRRPPRASSRSSIAHPALLPALWMFLTVLSVNFLGDRFRAAFDVKDAAL